jgi:hypothetical protein
MRAVCRSDLSKAVVLAHDNHGRFKPFQTNISIKFFLSSFVVCIHAYTVHVSFFPNKRLPMLKSFLSKAKKGSLKAHSLSPLPHPSTFTPLFPPPEIGRTDLSKKKKSEIFKLI